MNTLIYGGSDMLLIKKLEENLNIKCKIHSMKGLEKDYSNLELVKNNFKKIPLLDGDARKIYQSFFNDNFTQFNSMIVRRGLFLSDFHDLRDEFSVYYHSLFEILKKKKIELIIFFSFPHEGPDYILYKLAKHLKIKTLLFYQSIFQKRFFVISDLNEFGQIKKEDNSKENSKFLLNEDNSYISNINNYNLESSRKSDSFLLDLKKSRRKIRFVLLKILNFLKIIKRRNQQKEYLNNLDKIQISDEILNKLLNNGKKKIYFPLHFQPELTTSLLGENFDDQILIIERLSQFAGENYEIIVKENPRQTFYQRGEFFFKRIKFFKNVYFANKFFDSNELIKKTDITATVCGTPGWEAIKNGRKALLFGKSWFSGIHGCLKISDHTTDEEIKKFIEQEFDKSKFDKDFNNLMSQSYKGLIDLDYKNILKLKNFDEHKNATEIKNIILEILNVK